MDLSVILVNFNVYDDVKSCIISFFKNVKNISYEIIVADNCSTDRRIATIKDDFPQLRFIQLNDNKGFGAANNECLKIATGDYLLFINPDIIIFDNTPEKLLSYLKANPSVGAAGPVQEKPGSGVEHYYSFFPGIYSRLVQEFGLYKKAPGMRFRYDGFWDQNILIGKPFAVDWIIGSCLMIKRNVYEKIGGFDEAFFLYEEEVDLLFRMKKAGWKSVIIPECRVLHNHHSSTSKLGLFFILYHEYRSRIIFSAKQFKWPLSLIRKFISLSSIVFRFFYYTMTDFRTKEISKKRVILYIDLLKLLFSSKKKVMNSRFEFGSYVQYFERTSDARL